jgi:hypothetical protein
MQKIGKLGLMHLLLSALLLSGISMQGYADDSGDYVIAKPSISAPNMDMPAPKVSAPNMDMPSPIPKPLGRQNSILNQTSNQTSNDGSNQTQLIQTRQESQPMNATGDWSINLDNGTAGSLDLNLWSSGGTRIMGYGTLTQMGASSHVTASGSVGENDLKLIIKLATSDFANPKGKEYDIDLLKTNDTLSGTYVMMSAGQYANRGNATAVRQ